MNRIWKVSMLALLASGLFVASCKKKSGEGDSSKAQKHQESEAEEPKESEGDKAAKAVDESEQAEES
ncbi:MAG: hypothetical protein ABEN55_08035, partial [Bradymonadaceae bacterium]